MDLRMTDDQSVSELADGEEVEAAKSTGIGEQSEDVNEKPEGYRETSVECKEHQWAAVQESESMEGGTLPTVNVEPLGTFVPMENFIKKEPEDEESKFGCKEYFEAEESAGVEWREAAALVKTESSGSSEQVRFTEDKPAEHQEVKAELEEYEDGNWQEPLADVTGLKKEKAEAVPESVDTSKQHLPQEMSMAEGQKNQVYNKGDDSLPSKQLDTGSSWLCKDEVYFCEWCSYRTYTKHNLSKHYLSHSEERKFACDQCSYETNFSSDMNKHCLTHSKDKKLACDQCSYRTNCRGHLNQHSLTHNTEMIYDCDQCSYRTHVKRNLYRHYLIHNKEKLFSCDQCSYVSNYRSDLNQHYQTHSKDKNLNCDKCSYRTSVKRNLERHYLCHNKEKKFACGQCSYKTDISRNLNRHYRVHSKGKQISCD